MPDSPFRTALLVAALAILAFGGCGQSAATGERGLVSRSADVVEGYVLFTPILSATSYLVDTDGRVVHTWETSLPPGVSAYLLDTGDLLRSTQVLDPPGFPGAGGGGGAIQRLDWSGRSVWSFTLPSDLLQHHDLELLPNGNVLLIAHQSKTRSEALARPSGIGTPVTRTIFSTRTLLYRCCALPSEQTTLIARVRRSACRELQIKKGRAL